MKGSEAKLLDFMSGTKKRFIIPVYQRNYDWKLENCKQLYDDLIKVARSGRISHFFGSIVSSYQPSGRYTEYLVIDGQQRLTTVSLLMLAMYNLITTGKLTPELVTMAQEIYEDYLVDKHQPKETRIKLKPVKDDRKAFEQLFDTDEAYDRQSNLTNNYEYFYNRILKEEISLDQLYDALFTLEIINIELTYEDNPQLIFESLNSTGLALSEGDKIRNYILMGLPTAQQNEYYEKYWNRIELATDYQVSLFVRDYLSVKQQVIPAMNRVYVAFKGYVEDNAFETEPLLKEMLAYAKRYKVLMHGGTADKALNACIYRLNRLETTVTRPFFLEILRLQEEGILASKDVVEIFHTTESYLFRRVICSVPTNTLNKLFLTLHREIVRYDGKTADYLEKFKYALRTKRDSVRFPDDTEFVEAFKVRPVYQMNAKNKIYILERLENYGIVEDKDIYGHCDNGTYTIEHIMPQHLTPAWNEALGTEYQEIHDLWLHRLANLTLTGYNSKYSNSAFLEKRDMESGFAQSGLRMNTWVARQDKWTLEELQTRNEMMMKRALVIWEYPQTDYTPAEKQLDTYTLADDVDLTGRDILRFEYCNAEQPVASWADMLEKMVKILHATDKSVLHTIARNHDPENTLSMFFSNQRGDLRQPTELEDGIYYQRISNTNTKINILKRLFQRFDADPANLVMYLKDPNEEAAKETAGTRFDLRRRYWAFALPQIQQVHADTGCFSNNQGSKEYWITTSVGIRGFSIACNAKYNSVSVEVILQKADTAINKAAFDYVYARKDEVEEKLGTPLQWWRFDRGKSAYINLTLNDIGIQDESNWIQAAKFHAEWTKKIYDVIVPILREFVGQ